MKRDFYSRAALYLLLAGFAGTLLVAVTVGAYQAKALMDLSTQVTALANELGAVKLEMENVRAENAALKDTDRHIAVSLKENKLYLMEGMDALRVVPVATGSGRKLRAFGKEFDFSTPPGVYEVTRKETDPVWIAPEWNWLEKGVEMPDTITLAERTFRGHLGKYRLYLRDGIGIHGTDEPWSIGRYVTHGCVRVGAKDLEILFSSVPMGAKVYVY
jgi:L,D-transpeptidase ErfK/SrfK